MSLSGELHCLQAMQHSGFVQFCHFEILSLRVHWSLPSDLFAIRPQLLDDIHFYSEGSGKILVVTTTTKQNFSRPAKDFHAHTATCCIAKISSKSWQKIRSWEEKDIPCYIYSNFTSAGGLQGDFTFRWRRIECLGKYNKRIMEFCQRLTVSVCMMNFSAHESDVSPWWWHLSKHTPTHRHTEKKNIQVTSENI